MRITRPVTLIIASAALLLAACGKEPERSANDERDAGGEVLEGTISDAMIPMDQLRSHGDPADVEAAEAAGDDAAGPAGSAAPQPSASPIAGAVEDEAEAAPAQDAVPATE